MMSKLTEGHETNSGLERDHVREFQESLSKSSIKILSGDIDIDLNDSDPIEMATSRFLTYEYSGTPTLYLRPDYEAAVQSPIKEFSSRVSRAGKRSRHGVIFGDLNSEDGQQLSVAVKPHPGEESVQSSFGDYARNMSIHKLGFYTLESVGFLMDGKDKAYSITKLDETLTTLDSINWSGFYPDFDKDPGMKQIWSQVARQTALLHSMGSLMHGDLAARNIAATADDEVFLIDWEDASIDLSQPRDSEIRFGYSFTDLDVLVASMCISPDAQIWGGIGLFAGKPGNWFEGFRSIFYDEYEALRLDLAQGTKHETAVREELFVLKKELERSFEMHQSDEVKYGAT